ncbi:DMT family transporter [Corynebacterium sanguinis]|uniref:Multidrug efflux SMR transporter n=1 Tax=Corynebacterium sanguinis TaxID=2594913 RepID=A0A6C1U081_9CORY|nr:multidrug efflux SMR transporter [Corynebacterium sanguinis]MBA4505995.1 multidrug efflux SMR transporter [Corynebacterium sanguinis]MCT1412232.1 multidrug efflux SMR transporter [Corynebacterium sanguinis]MCT1492949.1 multidrug efflux SMR transporter [Corynebacterium sanguinis]MCT1500115.1 multidrug efflux SMR transporter [Corynebacterium sanguinis]MCT1554752.1 multidrug efflux SMR transporter [Corynebacterium sanguinis]
MAWIILLLSGAFEAVWAIALDRSQGLTRPAPAVVFFVALAISMAGLAWALRTVPLGTGYAVWVGVGASLAVVYSFVTGQESITPLKVTFLLMVVGGIAGLKLVG